MKGKRASWICVGLLSVVLVAAILAMVFVGLRKENTEPEYTYEALTDNLPEYDTDLFQIDGKLDESIYKELRWWEENYTEGDMQDPVKVRATSYLGKNGVYFIFDVDDDNVNVDMKRSSWNNSGMTVYVAAEGTHTLEDNVWEIDILPTDYINAKRYLGGYYYGTVRANGYENQPFVRTMTKEGDVNTPECKGYVMESYFPYEFLFKDEEVPENINLNFSIQRSYSIESDARDVYYNFGQYIMSNWSWGDPGTWWTFNKKGLDSVDLIFDASEGGKLEHRNDYIARYQTEKIKITPNEGYRIANLFREVDGTYVDVTDQIVWEDGQNYLKVRNATNDVKLKATFEKVPDTKTNLSGKISGGKADDLGVRFICGGVAYTAEVSSNGSYSLEVPTGKGFIEVYSKTYGYVAKRIDATAASDAVVKNISLSSNDYGNKRIMSLSSEQVMANKERLFNGEKMTGSMSKTFAYDFTLKYNGQLLEKDGTPVADPTFGEYDNQYTSVNLKGTFTDDKGKAIEKSDMQLQIMSWKGNGMWMAKMWLDGQYVEARIGIDELKAFGSESGVDFRLVFANSKLGLYIVRGNNAYKLTEIKTKSTPDRYLKTIDFYVEHCIDHSIWYVSDQSLALGRTEANSNVVATMANGDGVVNFKKSTNGKLVRTATDWNASKFDGAFGWTGTLRVPGVLKNGKVQYHEMKTGYWVDTSKDDKDWYQFTVYIIGDGDSYYVTKNNQKTKLELTEEQIKLLGTSGLQVGAFVKGNAISYFVDNGKGEMVVFADLYDYNENEAWYPWPNKYGGAYIIHEGAPKIGEVISTGAEFYTGLSKELDVEGFVKNILGEKYQANQALNPVTHTFGPDKSNYFVMNHKDVAENAFYGFNIKLDALKNTSVNVNVKAWAKEYYASYARLRVTEDSAYFIWQQGVSPYLCSEAVYFLNDAQLAKLTDGGLDIYIEYKDKSPELNLYVDDGTGKLVLASTYKEDLFIKSTGISELKNLIGYAVEVENTETDVTVEATGCVIPTDGSFENTVKTLYGKEITTADKTASLVKVDSREMNSASEKINLDYFDFNIGGNWFDKFNVKLSNAVDKNGKILTDSTVKMTARLQGDAYYGQSLNLHLEKDGIGYLQFVNYGGEWESYYYRLTDKQLAELASKDGLDLFVGHKEGDNQVTLYIEDGSKLLPLRSFTYGKTELWAKGYSASYEGGEKDSVEVNVECYKHENDLTQALKEAYNLDYKLSDEKAFIYTDIMEAAKAFDGKKDETVTKEHRKATDPSVWQAVLKSDAVNATGKVTKSAKTLMRFWCNDWKYNFDVTLNLTDTESILTLQEGELGEWKKHNYYLNKEQVAQLATEDGLKLYVSYENKRVTVYLEESADTLAKVLTFSQPDITMIDTRITFYESKASLDAAMSGYMYTNGKFIDAANTIFDNEYTNIRELTKVEVSNVSSHSIDAVTEKVNYDYGTATVAGTWLDHFNVKLPEAVDASGKILTTATVNLSAKIQGSDFYGQSLNLVLEKDNEGYLDMAYYGDRNGHNWEHYIYELTPAQLAQLASEEGLNLFAGHEDGENKVTIYLADGLELIPVKTFEYGEKELRGKGYAISYAGDETQSIEVKADLYKYDGIVEEIAQIVFDENATISEDKVTVYSEFVNVTKEFNASEKKSEDKSHRNVSSSSVWQTVLKSDAVDGSNFILKEFCHDNYEFAVGLLQTDTESVLTLQEGGPNWTLYKYSLSKEQSAMLTSEEGLKFYLSYEDDKLVVYLEEAADTLVKALSFTKPELKMHTTRMTYNESANAVNASVNGYVYENAEFVDAVNTIFNQNYVVREKNALENARVTMHTLDKASESFKAEYTSTEEATGTWMQHFNVKSDGLQDTTVKLNTRIYGSAWSPQNANIRITESGAYLEMQNYGGGGDWNIYVYELSENQLAQLKSENGLDIYMACANSNKITVYLTEGSKLIKVKEFTYASAALKGTGYEASYVGNANDRIQVLAECVKADGTITEVCKNLFDKNYTEEVATGVYCYKNMDNSNFGKTLTTSDKKVSTSVVTWNEYFGHVNIKNAGVNTNGVVEESSEVKVTHAALGNSGWLANTHITLKLQKDAQSTLIVERETSQSSTTTYTGPIELSESQLKALGSADGLDMYIAHSDSSMNSFVVYMEDGNVLREMCTVQYNNVNHGQYFIVEATALTKDIVVKGGAYNYKNTDLNTAINTVSGKDYSIVKQVPVKVEAENAVVSGMKNIYHVGDTLSFAVQLNDGYKLESVTLNDAPLTADSAGNYQVVLTEEYISNCNIKVIASLDTPYYSFATYTASPVSVDSTTKNKMKETGDYFLFQTNLKLAGFSGMENSTGNNGHARVLFDLSGNTANTPVYRFMLHRESGKSVLKVNVHNDSSFKEIIKELTASQVAKIEGNEGLNVFLVQTGETTYMLYIEAGDSKTVEKLEGSTYTYSGANHVSQYRYDTKTGKNPTVVTTGYFYKQNQVEGAQVANLLLGTIGENSFNSFATYTANTVSVDSTTMNKMKETGDYFLFQTNLKLAGFSGMENSTGNNGHARVLFDLSGNTANIPVYRFMLHRESGKSVLKVNVHNDSSFKEIIKELTASQVAKIEGNEGLNVFLVQTGETTYMLYIEAGDSKTVEKLEGSTYTYSGANHVSQYRYDTKTGKNPTVVTTGYFYKQNNADAAQVANKLME